MWKNKGTFNQEKALVGTTVITKSTRRFIKSSSVYRHKEHWLHHLMVAHCRYQTPPTRPRWQATCVLSGSGYTIHALGDAACLYIGIETQANTEQTNVATLIHWEHFKWGLFLVKDSKYFLKEVFFRQRNKLLGDTFVSQMLKLHIHLLLNWDLLQSALDTFRLQPAVPSYHPPPI